MSFCICEGNAEAIGVMTVHLSQRLVRIYACCTQGCVCVCVYRGGALQLPEYIKRLKKSFVICQYRLQHFIHIHRWQRHPRKGKELERKTPRTGREVKSANEREMQLCAFALGALIFYAAARFVIHLQGC